MGGMGAPAKAPKKNSMSVGWWDGGWVGEVMGGMVGGVGGMVCGGWFPLGDGAPVQC